jgi:nucleoside-diphosphate-sugar epimerase
MINVLLTGASGFLGKYIFKELLEKDINVFTLGRSKDSSIVCDLANKQPDLSYFKNIDFLIHVAGKAHIDSSCPNNSNDIYKTNVLGTKNLLSSLNLLSLKSIIFISSVSVYGCESGYYINEDHQLKSIEAYSSSKIEAERLIIDYCVLRRINYCIFRLPLVVGDNPPGNLGKMINAIKRGFYFNISNAEVPKSMVLAEDVARLILTSFDKSGIYNLTDGRNPTIAELSKSISKHLNRKRIISIPLWFAKFLCFFGDLFGSRFPLNSKKLSKLISPLTFDDSKARKELLWSPQSVIDSIKF